jgi:sorbitol-6-phosphate 2-dehydrogenase
LSVLKAFCLSLQFSFSTLRKKGEQMDFRGGGIRGIKAEAFFYYHSIIKRKQTHKTKKQAHKSNHSYSEKCLRRSKKMADWLNLEGKVVIVTGGASGIGNHVVTTLKDAGATPVIADISVETGEERDGIFCTKCDVTNKESVEAMVAAVVDKYGKLDAIVNNAGVNLPRLLVDVQGEKPQYELDEKSFNIMFNINVKGLMYCAQAAAKQMLKQGGGVIINMSSESGKEGSQGQSAYSATKGACDSFTRSWAKELGKYNIRVVAVAPGIMEATGLRTPAYNEALAYTRGVKPEDLSTDYTKVIPLGRDGKLDEVGNLVAFLVSDRSSYVAGTTYNISGGKSRG